MTEPVAPSDPRQLKAIVFADVSGYTRLMQEDEVATQHRVTEMIAMFEQGCREYDGEVLEIRGDGLFALFSSAVNSVLFANAAQERVNAFNDKYPDERKILFRIGIHLGDVRRDHRSHYGDNVNIAGRLETLTKNYGCTLVVSSSGMRPSPSTMS